MINDHTNEIRKIIEKQTAISEVKTINYAVLPPIGSAVQRSTAARKPPSPPLTRNQTSLLPNEDFDRMSLLAARRSTPLIRNTSVPLLNLHELPEDELLTTRPPESSFRHDPVFSSSTKKMSRINDVMLSAHDTNGSAENDDVEKIKAVKKTFAKIPNSMPDLDGLHNACEVMSENRLTKILEACRLYDRESRGYLNAPTIVKCIGEVIPSSHSRTSPYRDLLDYMSPNGELINYANLLDLFQKELALHSTQNFELILPELLQKPINWKLFRLPLSPSPSQEAKERGRAEVMVEIEVLLMRHPEFDLNRIKMATTKSEIERTEMLMILELYGYKQYFEPFIQRLYNSFSTRDDKFHFSAFVGCLDNIKPYRITGAREEALEEPPWLSKPLQKLSKPET
ncbi:unnamed protein product [Auanema sp. JU1783]|nr:unnamed protein product [Auanema sp. JU1783]